MKAVVQVRLYDGDGQQVAALYKSTGSKLVEELEKARTFTNAGHAKNSILHTAGDVAWRIRHGTLGEKHGRTTLARFFVVPVRLRLVATDAPEEYTP